MVMHICLHATLSFIPSFLPLPVDIREIRELRLGKGSRDFERYPEEARKVDASHCFIVLYGLEFRLRTLSLAGQCINCIFMCPSQCIFTSTVRRFSPLCSLQQSCMLRLLCSLILLILMSDLLIKIISFLPFPVPNGPRAHLHILCRLKHL